MKPGSLCLAERKILSKLLLCYPEFLPVREIEIMLWPGPDGGPLYAATSISVALCNIRRAIDPWRIESAFARGHLRLRFPGDPPSEKMSPRLKETLEIIGRFPGVSLPEIARKCGCADATAAQHIMRLKNKLAAEGKKAIVSKAYHGYRLVEIQQPGVAA